MNIVCADHNCTANTVCVPTGNTTFFCNGIHFHLFIIKSILSNKHLQIPTNVIFQQHVIQV